MPTAKIQTPDGRMMTLQVPDGATKQQIIDYARSQYQKLPKTAPVAPDVPQEQPTSSSPQIPEAVQRRIQEAYNAGDWQRAKFLEQEASRVASQPEPQGPMDRIAQAAGSVGRRIGYEFGQRYENIKEAVTGESRQTDLSRSLPDLGFPNIAEYNAALKQYASESRTFGLGEQVKLGIIPPQDPKTLIALDAIAAFSGSDNETIQMARQIPGVSLIPDEKGNVVAVFPNGYMSMLNKPGISGSDLKGTATKAIEFGMASRVAGPGVWRQILGAVGAQTAMEAGGSAFGGEFNPEEIVLAGVLEGVGHGLAKGIAKGWSAMSGAERRGIRSWRDLEGRISNDEFSRLRELKEAQEAFPDAPVVTKEQFSVAGRPDLKAELDQIRKATATIEDAEKIGKRFRDQDVFATREIRKQVESIAPGGGIEVGVRKAKEASEKIFDTMKLARSAEANALFGKAREGAYPTDLRPVRQRIESMLRNETIPTGEKERVQNSIIRMMTKRNADGSLRNAVIFDFDRAQQLKFEIDDLIKGRGETSVGKNAQKALIEIRDTLVDEIDRAAPGYKEANKAYRQRTENIDLMEETLVGLIRDTEAPRLSRVMNLFNDKDVSNVLQLKGLLDLVDPSAYHSLYKGWLNDMVTSIPDLEGSRNASKQIWDKLFATPKTWDRIKDLAPSKSVAQNLEFLRDYVKYSKEIRLGTSASKESLVEAGADIIKTDDVQGPVAAIIKGLKMPYTTWRANALTEAILNPRWAEEMKGIREAAPSARMAKFDELLSKIGYGLRTGTAGYDMETQTQGETLNELNQQQQRNQQQ